MCDSTRTQGKDNQYLTGFPLRFLFGATKIQSTCDWLLPETRKDKSDMYKYNYNAKEFGERIKMIRKENKMMQSELAEKLLLSVDNLSRMENGKITCMPEHLLHICEIFDVTTDYFYFGERIEKSKKEDITSVNAEIYAMLDVCSPKELKKIKAMMKVILEDE